MPHFGPDYSNCFSLEVIEKNPVTPSSPTTIDIKQKSVTAPQPVRQQYRPKQITKITVISTTKAH